MPNRIILLLGKSGCGKSTIANILEKTYELEQLPSYTTRPPRDGEINGVGHEFITMRDYINFEDDGEIVASTYFHGNYYFSTSSQVDKYPLYVIDNAGLIELKSKRPDLEIIPIYIDAPLLTRIKRMRSRGDSIKSIIGRVFNDYRMFKGAKSNCDFILDGLESPETLASYIADIYIFDFYNSDSDLDKPIMRGDCH